ncbi:MAG: RsmB/NOP family class I SAM-dependent RNA methyltransferase [Muribaculaceae bacterium]|nr:RsmB/NOP family class I SAM-dependent RNA methyltransferase [Muribaculaceae bacterium]
MSADKFLQEGFKAQIRTEIGENNAEILFSALCGEPETSFRLNVRKMTKDLPYAVEKNVEWCKSGYYLPERPNFTLNPLLHAGTFYVQDASSMVYETIVHSLFPDSPAKVCDLCAAPGGKTTAILNALPDGSTMLANEFISSRAQILAENLCKYGYPETVVTNCDTSKLAKMKGRFDLVAVDAPCSGEGMMRKDETARSQWSQGLVKQCAALQKEILGNAVDMVAPGGFLIFSTCSFNTTEDEDNAAWLAETFGLESIDTGLAGKYGIQGQVKGNIQCLRFMPGFTRGEGLFLAVFKKPDDASGFIRRSKDKKKNRVNDKIDKKFISLARSWTEDNLEIICHDGHILAMTPATSELLDEIPKGIRIISVGVEIGEIKGKDLIPAHALAMSTIMSHPFPEVELSTENALRYLAREAILLPEETPKGYVTVTHKGHPLGFAKNLGNRSNNLYPQEYRIRNLNLTN